MSFTLAVVVISSPATTRAPHMNSCPPCTIIAKLSSISGSNIGGPTDGALYTTANMGGATTSASPAAGAASPSTAPGLVSPTARAYSLIFSRPTAYTTGSYVLPIAFVLTGTERAPCGG